MRTLSEALAVQVMHRSSIRCTPALNLLLPRNLRFPSQVIRSQKESMQMWKHRYHYMRRDCSTRLYRCRYQTLEAIDDSIGRLHHAICQRSPSNPSPHLEIYEPRVPRGISFGTVYEDESRIPFIRWSTSCGTQHILCYEINIDDQQGDS